MSTNNTATKLKAAYKKNQADQNEFIKGLENLVFGAPQPHNIELEKAVIGACLLEREAFPRVNFLLPSHFYDDKHAIIWEACSQLYERELPIDLLTVTDFLKNMKKWRMSGELNVHFSTIDKTEGFANALEAIGGAFYLVELTKIVASTANLEYHARILYQKYLSRDYIRKLYQGLARAHAEEGDIFEERNTMAEELLVSSPSAFFRVRSWNQVIEDAGREPEMFRLAGELLHQNSITILFGPPGSAKSIGAVQLGNAIASGRSFLPGILVNELGNEVKQQPEELSVLFIDMELFDREVEKRYTEGGTRYQFSPNFYRVDPNPNFLDYPEEDMDKYINRQIETLVRQRMPQVLIVDNITALSSESASDINIAIKIMRFLKRLRIRYNLTILVLAHTTKHQNKMEQLTLSAMKGASAFQDFAPTIFGINENANEEGTYYLKQLKARNSEKVFGASNVIRYRTSKIDNMLSWEFIGLAHEDECLKSFMEAGDQEEYIKKAVELKAKDWTKGWRKIHQEIGYPHAVNTLIMRCKMYVQGSQMYELDPNGNFVFTGHNKEGSAEAAPPAANNPSDTVPF
jgi:RecA-family ATPase